MKRLITKEILLKHISSPTTAYNIFRKGVREQDSFNSKAAKNNGTEVGLLARGLYPGGVDASLGGKLFGSAAAAYTIELIRAGIPIIYEAWIESESGPFPFVADVLLVRDNHVIEVKSSTRVYNEAILELGYCRLILTDLSKQYSELLGEKTKYSLIHLNMNYIKNGDIDLKRLFVTKNVTNRVLRSNTLVKKYLRETAETVRLSSSPKQKKTERWDKYKISKLRDECFHYLNGDTEMESNTLTLKKEECWILDQGVMHMRELLRDNKSKRKSLLDSEKKLDIEINYSTDWVYDWLKGTDSDCVTFLQFATFSCGIPSFDKTRPYQRIPFHYSTHTYNGEIARNSFCGEFGPKIQKEFIENLLSSLASTGPILCYNLAFEVSVLADIVKAYPEYSCAIKALVSRMRELLLPFKELMIYNPENNATFTFKSVVSEVIDKLNEGRWSLTNGNEAIEIFFGGAHLSTDERKVVVKVIRTYLNINHQRLLEAWDFLSTILRDTNDKINKL